MNLTVEAIEPTIEELEEVDEIKELFYFREVPEYTEAFVADEFTLAISPTY